MLKMIDDETMPQVLMPKDMHAGDIIQARSTGAVWIVGDNLKAVSLTSGVVCATESLTYCDDYARVPKGTLFEVA